MKIYDYLRENQAKLIIFLPIFVIIFLLIGCLVLPRIFYDNFVWKYFWGPIASDALGETQYLNGIEAADKFTWVSEIVYGFILIYALYGCYKILNKWKIAIDWHFFVGLLPFILFGTIARVFEDTEFYSEPLSYWFVTPLIYIQMLFLVLILLVIGYFLQTKFNSKNKHVNVPNFLFLSGSIILIPHIYYILLWLGGDRWSNSNGISIAVFFLVMGLVGLIVSIVYLFSRFFNKYESVKVYSKPINLALIAGHMIDGLASYISIYNPFNMNIPPYSELHPASDILMQIWPPLYPIVKFLLMILVIYVFDIMFKEELKSHQKIIYILKIAIFILGFAPGFRDILRVMMGV